MITAAGLVVGEVKKRDDSAQPAGTVLSSDPLPGVKVEKGATVTITVSSGKSSVRTVDVIVHLPSGVNQDIELKAYLDGSLYEMNTVNPSLNDLYTLSFEGSSGQKQLVIRLNDQEYAVFTVNFEQGTAKQTAQNTFVPDTPEPDEPESSEEGGEGSTGITTD